MKIDDVTKIKNLTDEKEINEYLAKGYKIIKIFSMKISNEFGEEVKPVFVLGLAKEVIV